MERMKTLYARIWAPIFLLAGFYFYPTGEDAHHMMGSQLLGLPEMTWMWILMAFAHLHLFWHREWQCGCKSSSN